LRFLLRLWLRLWLLLILFCLLLGETYHTLSAELGTSVATVLVRPGTALLV
jgi:hypothetical protein